TTEILRGRARARGTRKTEAGGHPRTDRDRRLPGPQAHHRGGHPKRLLDPAAGELTATDELAQPERGEVEGLVPLTRKCAEQTLELPTQRGTAVPGLRRPVDGRRRRGVGDCRQWVAPAGRQRRRWPRIDPPVHAAGFVGTGRWRDDVAPGPAAKVDPRWPSERDGRVPDQRRAGEIQVVALTGLDGPGGRQRPQVPLEPGERCLPGFPVNVDDQQPVGPHPDVRTWTLRPPAGDRRRVLGCFAQPEPGEETFPPGPPCEDGLLGCERQGSRTELRRECHRPGPSCPRLSRRPPPLRTPRS